MELTYAEKQAKTIEALLNPQVGDRFHEMYSWWVYVLDVDEANITYISASAPCSFPKDGIITTISRTEFLKHFCYDSIPDKSYVMLADRGNNVEGWLPGKVVEPKPVLPKLWDWVGIE